MKLDTKMLAATIRLGHRGSMPQTIKIDLPRHYNPTERASLVETIFRGKSLDIKDYRYIETFAGTNMNHFEDIAIFEKK